MLNGSWQPLAAPPLATKVIASKLTTVPSSVTHRGNLNKRFPVEEHGVLLCEGVEKADMNQRSRKKKI
ncbi:unnamed protein product, partial [Iphiclides podalirius]